jgi:Protein of unknown function (DUF2971)
VSCVLKRSVVTARFESEFPVRAADKPKASLWHYTDAVGFMGIIDTKTIHATHFAHLNDPGELRFGQRVVSKVLDAAREACSSSFGRGVLWSVQEKWEEGGDEISTDTRVFVASFCADNGNRLSQWRGYSKDGAGYSLGFRSLGKGFGEGLTLVKVDYRSDTSVHAVERDKFVAIASMAEKFREDADSASDRKFIKEQAAAAADRLVASMVVRTKHKAFSEEREWRIVASPGKKRGSLFRASTRRGLVPYLPIRLAEGAVLLALKGVMIGPTHHDAGEAAAKYYLRRKGYANADKLVSASGIPFRG